LGAMMELPSRGSKARVYCSVEGEEGDGVECCTGRSTGSSSLLAVVMVGHWVMAARMRFSAATSTLSSGGVISDCSYNGLKEAHTVVAKGVRCAGGRNMVRISQGLSNFGYAIEEGWYHRGDERITAAILWEDGP
jgi:hypothetical protein